MTPHTTSPVTCGTCEATYVPRGKEEGHRHEAYGPKKDVRFFHSGQSPKRPRWGDRREHRCGCIYLWTNAHDGWRAHFRCREHAAEHRRVAGGART